VRCHPLADTNLSLDTIVHSDSYALYAFHTRRIFSRSKICIKGLDETPSLFKLRSSIDNALLDLENAAKDTF
jgi:hypothetical protein